MISSMTQRIEKYYCQLSESLKIHRDLMSNFSYHLPACYTYTVIIVCCFTKGFVLPFQRARFISYFTLEFLFDYNFNFNVSPIQIKYISGKAFFYVFTFFLFFFKHIIQKKKTFSIKTVHLS